MLKLNEVRNRLISYGYHPDEVEYALVEILQYKRADLINKTDLKVLLNMLQERMEINRAELKSKIFAG